jgi:hypothetical protein
MARTKAKQETVSPRKTDPRRAGVMTVWRPSVTVAQLSRRAHPMTCVKRPFGRPRLKKISSFSKKI